MRIRTAVAAGGATLALLGLAAAPASASDVPPKFACADIVGGEFGYVSDQFGNPTKPYTLLAAFDVAAPSCTSPTITYLLYVYDNHNGTKLIVRKEEHGYGHDQLVTFTNTIVRDGTACVVGVTRDNQRVIDRAPDTGCAIVDYDGIPARPFQ